MSYNKKSLVTDLVKVATFNIVAHILMHVKYNDSLFDTKFIYSLIFILIGFTVYHLYLDSIVSSYFTVKDSFYNAKTPSMCKTLSSNNANCKWNIGEYIFNLHQEIGGKRPRTVWTRRMNTGEPNDPNKFQLEFTTGSELINLTGTPKNPIRNIYRTISNDEQFCCKLNVGDIKYIFQDNKMYTLKVVIDGLYNKKTSTVPMAYQIIASCSIDSNWTVRTKSNF